MFGTGEASCEIKLINTCCYLHVRTMGELELVERTRCDVVSPDEGNIVGARARWSLEGRVVTRISVPTADLTCSRSAEKINMFLPIPELTHSEAEDLCHKFGENVPIGGNFEDKAGFDAYYEGLLENGKFVSVCGFYDNSRLKTWLPYKHNSDRSLLVHQGTGLALLPNQTDK